MTVNQGRPVSLKPYVGASRINYFAWSETEIEGRERQLRKDLKGKRIEDEKQRGKFEDYFYVLDALAKKYRGGLERAKKQSKSGAIEIYTEKLHNLYSFFSTSRRKRR